MRRTLRILVTGSLVACGVSRPWGLVPSPAVDPPARFVPADSSTPPAASCRVHLADPRDGTRLRLVRSTGPQARGAVGDYAVAPTGRYGVGPDHLLRVNCDGLDPLGVVKGE